MSRAAELETKSKNVKPNVMDSEFDNFWLKVSCFAANNFPYEERCAFVQQAVDCNLTTNLVPYMKLLSCDLKCVNDFEKVIFVNIFVGICFLILVMLIHTINDYYIPALKAISQSLHMNEHLAGVTLLAFGNSSADLFSNLAHVKERAPVFANSLSSALFVITISGGLICYISPFKMNGYETIRDILFLICGASMIDLIIVLTAHTSHGHESYFLIVFMVYVAYIIVNITDFYLLRKTLRSTVEQINELNGQALTPENELLLKRLEKRYKYYSQDREVEFYEKSSQLSITRIRYTTLQMVRNTRVSLNRHYSRIADYDRRNPKNARIFKDFFLALRPIKCQAWRQADMLNRVLLLLRAPADIICTLCIPLVDYELKKHGWNKLLNCLHVIVNPALSISAIMSILQGKRNRLWYSDLDQKIVYGAYSLVITVPIAVFVLIHSRTDVPPAYHWIFMIMNLTGSMTLIFICATEIDGVLEVLGNLMAIDDDFMGATVKAVTGNLGTLIANLSVAFQGYPKMAFASAIGGPFFTIVVTGNAVIYVRSFLGDVVSDREQMERYGLFAYMFFHINLITILLWSTTLGFFARRSMGVYSIAVYMIYLLFAILVHAEFIHSIIEDPEVSAAIGDI
ncbi:mitochondrial sodium/calcium exchanger protein isoform X2 [Drosophila eugracilis]|uniref:mitochondrial sodium/calcium exchanger protein isoform X2 n=1 Tax=Drosophila eugracilis TaxID=29029 RepID=UPI0007E6A22E|nr:mitochondrial sodium/calcium exchanger protein isoform X2 [Drosophila eugracilis]